MKDTDPKLTDKQNEWVTQVVETCNSTKYRMINPGLCFTCHDCASQFGYDECTDEFEEAIENGTVCDEGGFSWQNCDVCGSSLGGDRYAAHGHDSEGSIIHYDICCDCLAYLANGDVPTLEE